MLVNIVVLVLVKGRIQCIGIIFDYELGEFLQTYKIVHASFASCCFISNKFLHSTWQIAPFQFFQVKNLMAYNSQRLRLQTWDPGTMLNWQLLCIFSAIMDNGQELVSPLSLWTRKKRGRREYLHRFYLSQTFFDITNISNPNELIDLNKSNIIKDHIRYLFSFIIYRCALNSLRIGN